MTEEDPSAFSVTDRRAASQSATETDADTTPAKDEAASVSDAKPSAAQSPPAETPEPDTETESYLPDPAMLLSLAAMQMDTRILATALLAVFDGHAWRAMGLIADPRSGEPEKDLPTAQLAIDCVQFLLSKVESGLSDDERRDAHRRLNDLRMNYLAKLRET